MREDIVERVKELIKNDPLKFRSILSPREIKILRLMCGLENGRRYTTREISKMFNLPTIEVRGIWLLGLDKLFVALIETTGDNPCMVRINEKEKTAAMLYNTSTKKTVCMEKDNAGVDWKIVKIEKECKKCMGGWDITIGLTEELREEHILDIVITEIRKHIPTFNEEELKDHKVRYI